MGRKWNCRWLFQSVKVCSIEQQLTNISLEQNQVPLITETIAERVLYNILRERAANRKISTQQRGKGAFAFEERNSS